jgi:hypothetical protein
MLKIKEIIQYESTKILKVAIIGALGYLFAVVWKEISLPLVQKVIPELSNKGLLAIILIQFLVLIGTFVYIFVSRNKRYHYRFDKRLGIYLHKKTGEPFCTSCLTSNIESPLKEEKQGWYCDFIYCEKFYTNPDYTSPPR